jgi:hypothetical protein
MSAVIQPAYYGTPINLASAAHSDTPLLLVVITVFFILLLTELLCCFVLLAVLM